MERINQFVETLKQNKEFKNKGERPNSLYLTERQGILVLVNPLKRDILAIRRFIRFVLKPSKCYSLQHKHTKQAFGTPRIAMSRKGICLFISREMPDLVARSASSLVEKCQFSKYITYGACFRKHPSPCINIQRMVHWIMNEWFTWDIIPLAKLSKKERFTNL